MTVETVDGAPPVSSFAATFGCHWYAGELVMTMNYDRHQFGIAAAHQLMSAYVERLAKTADAWKSALNSKARTTVRFQPDKSVDGLASKNQF